jgi:predicted transcriptional regulator
MSYETIIAFRVSAETRAALDQLAEARETDIGKIMRLLVARELGTVRDPLADLREQVLFAALGVDGILTHLDPQLRTEVMRLWQDRIMPGGSHGA